MNRNDAPNGDDVESVTIYEVARRAGVSIATVSHALNRPERVAESTLKRVLDTAETLGFTPKGRGQAAKSLRRVVVVAPFSRYSSYLARLVGVTEAARGISDVVVVDHNEHTPYVAALPVHGTYEGVIFMGVEPSSDLAAQLHQARVSTVAVDHDSAAMTTIVVDDIAGGQMIAQHLWDVGAHHVLLLSPPPERADPITNGELRVRSMTERLALLATQLKERDDRDTHHSASAPIVPEVQWLVCEDSLDSARASISDLDVLPDAIVAMHDSLAAGAMVALRHRVAYRCPTRSESSATTTILLRLRYS